MSLLSAFVKLSISFQNGQLKNVNSANKNDRKVLLPKKGVKYNQEQLKDYLSQNLKKNKIWVS